MDEYKETIELICTDINMTIVVKIHKYYEHYIDFDVYNIVAFAYDAEKTNQYNFIIPIYEQEYGNEDITNIKFVKDKTAFGRIKFDGCTSFEIYEVWECDRDGLSRYSKMLNKCFDIAKDIMPNFLEE